MPVFTKRFRGVPEGEIYPVTFEQGDECPSELVAAAEEAGALDAAPPKAAGTQRQAAGARGS